MSHRSAIYYADLTVREGMVLEEAIAAARQTDERRRASGYDQAALDQAARDGFANGAFEDNEEDGGEVVEEFYPEMTDHDIKEGNVVAVRTKPSLKSQLDQKMTSLS